jgi:uncharacterized protein with PIN domain
MSGGCTHRFLVDLMLGRLVSWLRLLGCDTLYAGKLDDAAIARLAQQENRLVLTRDRELARRKNIETLLIDSEHVDDQLVQVVHACHLDVSDCRPRCAACNGVLADAAKQEIAGSVPPYVFRTQDRFLRCGGCGHIYWQGTHWEHMQKRLARLAG